MDYSKQQPVSQTTSTHADTLVQQRCRNRSQRTDLGGSIPPRPRLFIRRSL